MAAAEGKGKGCEEEVTSLPTSTKWSVLSSRVEGLVAELSQVVGNMDAYCVSKSNAEGPAMAAVRAKMISTPWAEEWSAKRTMFSYGEEMSTDPLEAMLLKELVYLGKPGRVLEIGMFVGYGAVAMLEGCPTAKVVSLEIDPYLKDWLSSCLKDFPEIIKRHEIVVGPALESLPKLVGAFDMVFIDANKAEYKDYVKAILAKNLLADGGMIVCDNILYNGYPYTNDHFDAQPARRGFGDAIKDFNQWVYEQPELEQIVLPIRDGVSFIRRRPQNQIVKPELGHHAELVPSTLTMTPHPTGKSLPVTVVCCGAPKRGMGWYHCRQLLHGHVSGAELANVVEPWFLGKGKDGPFAADFAQWKSSVPSVAFHAGLQDMPQQTGRNLVMICGRTADNPKLFKEAVDRGFTHVYLEKPGAPSVAELQEMHRYAEEKGVFIFMGFNRNFSKYVKSACDIVSKDPVHADFTLARFDCFNSNESLDECFVRNAEGMMKNMMCHELMVLITYYGLTVDSIQKVVVDRNETVCDKRCGMRDYSRVSFRLVLKSGQTFSLFGDRTGGEHAEAVVRVNGEVVHKAARPDPEIQANASRLEKEEPGCMPYFYLQDTEYMALKQCVVDHVLQEAEGYPQGVASVPNAIECLKLCDYITDALDNNCERFQYPLNIGNHPCSWGVDYADCPTNPPWEKVIECMANAGFAGTELGPVGYYDNSRLGEVLQSFNLKLTAGNIFENLHKPEEVPAILEKVHKSCSMLKEHGGKLFVIVPHVVEERIATTGRSADAPRLPDAVWKPFMEAIKKVAEVCRSYGVMCTLHPHAGCWIEYEDDVERAMSDLPADLVGLCLDSGHFTYAGMDAVAMYKKYASRVPYMHFKDINGKVLSNLRSEKKGFWDGIKSGVFCPLGQGLVDFPALLRAMKANGFSGWVTVEQDADNSIPDVEKRLMGPFESCKLNMQYLKSLGVCSVEPVLKRIPGVKEFHTFQRAPNHTVVDIFMREKGIEDAYFEEVEVWINLDMEDNRNAKNLAMNPQGSIPWFVMDDGSVIAETITMCEYIEDVMPENPLVGRDAKERATVRMWQRRMEEHYCYPAFYGHRFWTSSSDCPEEHFMRDFFVDRLNQHGGAKVIPSVWKDLCEWARNRIMWLERVKQEEAKTTGKTTDFIAGDFFSLVDIQVYTVLWFFAYAFPYPPQTILEELSGQVPWVQAWYDRCHARPSCVAAREDREKDLRLNKTEPRKHLQRLAAKLQQAQ
jgi:inosose dehydratase